MPKLVAVQLETNDHNTDGVAWFAYVEGKTTPKQAQALAEQAYDDEEAPEFEELISGGALGADFSCDPEELPNALSKYAKLKRFYVAYAV